MNKIYRFTMPTPERCKELGIKFEGLYSRTQMWFMGVSCGVSWCSGAHLMIAFPTKNTVTVNTDSATLLNNITDRLESYGFTREAVPSMIDSPCVSKERWDARGIPSEKYR